MFITGHADLVVGPGVGLVHCLCRRGKLRPNAVGGIIEMRDEVAHGMRPSIREVHCRAHPCFEE